MKITLITVGNAQRDYIIKGVKVFSNRINKYVKLDFNIVKDAKYSVNPYLERIREIEGARIQKNIDNNSFVVVLDEHGEGMTSMEFSKLLEKNQMAEKDMTFIIGGAYGLDEPIIKNCDLLLSLSVMTLPHEMTQLLLLEQIYRGFSIINDEPYHNG